MVKKHKGGRRQILQLDDKKSSKNEVEPTSTAVVIKEASPLDSQVADFFKEIDALTVNENNDVNNSEAAASPSEVASCSKQRDSEDSRSQDGVTDKAGCNNSEHKGPYCAWQEICDESTGYNYYWNTETNEVTWDCPSEYIVYLKSLQPSDFGPQSNHLNSSETQKNPPKKKETSKHPEGTIIPISYYGDTSSEESSEEDQENGLDTTSKSLSKEQPKLPKESASKTPKQDTLSSSIKSETVEVMGPHLPPVNHTSKRATASRTAVKTKEADVCSKNEVDEYFEIGPQLPSVSQLNLSVNSECNTVSDSSSKCPPVHHSFKNGPVASSTFEEPWEVSLMNIDRKFRGLDEEVGEESPDSTVRKGDSLPENNVPCQTSNDVSSVQGVVEYDNFTDEEEEMSSNISSSKQDSNSPVRSMSTVYKNVKDQNISHSIQSKFKSTKSEISQSEGQRNVTKRKIFSNFDEYDKLNNKKAKQKSKVDIESLFNNYSQNHKYGFGFSRQEQLNLESDLFCSTSSHPSEGTSKGQNSSKTINFVKSNHIFELNTVNKNVLSHDSSTNSGLSSEDGSKQNCENLDEPGSSNLTAKHLINSTENSKESCVIENSETVKEEIKDFGNSTKSSDLPNCDLETNELSGQKDDLSLHSNTFFEKKDVEVVNNVQEASEVEVNESIVSKPLSSSSVSSNQRPELETVADEPMFCNKDSECAKLVEPETLSENIISLSSNLIDKLTFLISNHSTLTSLTSLLIQIQTRLIDWQTGALESMYFMSRLQEVQLYLHQYEVNAVSGDWSCQWDKENKRYFYVNTRTQQSQWTYPEELCGRENSWMPSSSDIASTSANPSVSVERDELQTVSSSVPEGQLLHKPSVSFAAESSKAMSENYSDLSAMWLSESSPPPPPPGVDSPPPPPPHSPPPDSPPPPPPDSTEVEDLLEDMDIENSDDSSPPLIVTNSRTDTPADSQMSYPKYNISPERQSDIFTNASLANAVSSTSLSSFEDMNIVSKSPQLVSTSREALDSVESLNLHWSVSLPSCSTDIASTLDSESEAIELPDHKITVLDKDSEISASTSKSNHPSSNEASTYQKPCNSYPSTSSAVAATISSTPSTSKKEKKKTKLSSGLALKKKNIPSLVEKWQKIKAEIDKEDKDSEDSRK